MPKRNGAQQWHIRKVLERVDWVFAELCDCKHELEDCGCKTQEKKLDTITGRVENLLNDLYEITKE